MRACDAMGPYLLVRALDVVLRGLFGDTQRLVVGFGGDNAGSMSTEIGGSTHTDRLTPSTSSFVYSVSVVVDSYAACAWGARRRVSDAALGSFGASLAPAEAAAVPVRPRASSSASKAVAHETRHI